MEPFDIVGQDSDNPTTHTVILVRGKEYSVYTGSEQATANEIATNLDAE